MSRFNFPIPSGWFWVANADELKPGDVQALKYFGRDLVLWRDSGGDAHLQDAFCPHLGAHLGVGGRVEGESILCPFHEWAFDGTGSCTNIPYSERLNRKAQVKTYLTKEVNHFIIAWYHPTDREPNFEVPDLEFVDDPAWTTAYDTASFTIKSIPQEMGENAVDPAHFKYVHGTDGIAEVKSYDTAGAIAVMDSIQSYSTPQGVVYGQLKVSQYGPGVSTTHFAGIIDTFLTSTITPIDDQTTLVRFNFITKKHEDERFTQNVGTAFKNMVCQQVTEDIPIWEHKTFIPVPALADTDGPITQYRKWFAQFYE